MRVYFDHAASTPCDQRVVEAMMPYFTNVFGNGGSQHGFGRDAEKAIADSRATIAKLINCQPNELYFTASGTESDNWAIKGAAFARKTRVITSLFPQSSTMQCLFLPSGLQNKVSK